MHNIAEGWVQGSDMFYITSTLVTFCLPVIMLFIPWLALLIQVCPLLQSFSLFWKKQKNDIIRCQMYHVDL